METKRYIHAENKENRGGLIAFKDGTFEAFTMTEVRKYKTLRGAKNFLARNGYIELVEEVEKDSSILDLTGVSFSNIEELKNRLVINWAELPAPIRSYILEADSFYFDGYQLLIYKDNKVVAVAEFEVQEGKMVINSIGAGSLFQWSKTKGLYEANADFKVIEEVGYVVLVKETGASINTIKKAIQEARKTLNRTPLILTKALECAKKCKGKWIFQGAKLKEADALEMYKSIISHCGYTGTKIRLIRCNIKYFEKSGLVIREHFKEFEIIKEKTIM